MNTKTILVAVDSTQAAENALRVAANMAHDLSARLILLHVIKLDVAVNPSVAVGLFKSTSVLLDEAEWLLAAAANEVSESTQVDRVIRQGDSAHEIVKLAAEVDADFIAIGIHRRNALGRMLLGSTADAVIRKAGCPVLAVCCDPSHKPGAPEESGVQSTGGAPQMVGS